MKHLPSPPWYPTDLILPSYADLITEDLRCQILTCPPSLTYKLNENQLALEAAVMELSSYVEQRGSEDIADNAHGALAAIDKNEEFIEMTLTVMMAPE